ncbi:MAG: zf-HC2 domain-containing protein [Bryobacteraceae bacterium]|nr:zf-HC2 domain-containing protein [Bryobacteraceae bacterium]MDW8377865.1 zf-HC2 domain-containing protein [Bryobacterales bacterium]
MFRFFRLFQLKRDAFGCWQARRDLPDYVDGGLPQEARHSLSMHLRVCARCAARYDELAKARWAMKRLPKKHPPAQLTAALRVLASKECLRRQAEAQGAWGGFGFQAWTLRMRNLIEPLALPFAGGVLSALVLFSMLAPTYPIAVASSTPDVPTAFHVDPSIKSAAPFSLSKDEVVVEVVIDGEGRMVDYRLPAVPANSALRREVENNLLFVRFTPAMSFGQPTAGRLRLSFRRSQIDVKG